MLAGEKQQYNEKEMEHSVYSHSYFPIIVFQFNKCPYLVLSIPALLFEEKIISKKRTRDGKLRMIQYILFSIVGLGYCLAVAVFTEYRYLCWASAKTVKIIT